MIGLPVGRGVGCPIAGPKEQERGESRLPPSPTGLGAPDAAPAGRGAGKPGCPFANGPGSAGRRPGGQGRGETGFPRFRSGKKEPYAF
jgi:hypothetical protein